MSHLLSFFKGLVILVAMILTVYYGMVLINRWTYGAKALISLLLFPVILIAAGYATQLITFNKLGNTGSFLVSILLLIVVGGFQKMNYEKAQVAGFLETAEELNFEYHHSLNLSPELKNNPIMLDGYMATASNALTGEYRGVNVTIFNYQYEQDSGDTPDHYFRTVLLFEDTGRRFPDFHIRPRSWGDRLFGLHRDKQEIKFPEDPDFSDKYHLLSGDRAAASDLIGERQRRTLTESARSWSVAGTGNLVMIFADDRMDEQVDPNPEDIRSYLEQAWPIYNSIRSSVN